MTFHDIAMNLWPGWVLGFVLLVITYFSSNRNLIRVQKDSVIKWTKYMAIMLVSRVILLSMIIGIKMHYGTAAPFVHSLKSVLQIPWPAMLFVFWEDAVHVLPLIILRKMMETRKWLRFIYYPLLAILCLDFGLGHMYEGLIAVAIMVLYIPINIRMGEKYGVGTVMVCHTMYDLSTRLAVYLALI